MYHTRCHEKTLKKLIDLQTIVHYLVSVRCFNIYKGLDFKTIPTISSNQKQERFSDTQ